MFDDTRIPLRLKLSALWCSVMFCYLYGDYFELYSPGKLPSMLSGRMALGPISQGVLLGMAVMMAIPSLMIFLSLILSVTLTRWLNVVLGAAYTLIIVLVLLVPGSWYFYLFLGLVEIALTLTIVWYAWTWPKQPASPVAR